MIIYEIMRQTNPVTLQQIINEYNIKMIVVEDDPEDDYEFRFFDKLMREVPRR